MSNVQILILILALDGLLFMALGLAMPGLSRSRVVGIRLRATLEDQRVWRDTHMRAGPRLVRVGAVVLVGGIACATLPLAAWVAAVVFATVFAGSLAWFTWDARRYANARLVHYRRIDEATARAGRLDG